MALTLVSFGSPRLLDERGAAVAFPEKALLAAAYIAARPTRTVTRSELAAFLWGDDATDPLANLRQLLTRVRSRQQEIGATILEVSGGEITAARGTVDCDFLQLMELDADRPLEILEASLVHVTGGFFEGIGTVSERADLWLMAQQEQALLRIATALQALAHQIAVPASRQLMKQAAYRLLDLDPYNEVACRSLIDAFTAEGNIARAKTAFDRYRHRLERDLDAQPDSGMLALRDHLHRQAAARLPAAPATELSPAQATLPGRIMLPRLMLMPPAPRAAGTAGLLATSLLEDVTISLCRAKSVLLVAPHTARRIAAMDDAGRQAFYRNSDISYILETRVATDTGGDALYASLTNIPEDAILWAERLPIDAANLGTAYDTIVRRIAAAAISRIERHEFARAGRTAIPTAYQNFLIGTHHLRNIELPGIRRARKAFRAVLKEVPEFPAALGGLSRTEHLEWLLTARGDAELLKSSERHAQAAINADADAAVGFHQLAVTKLYRGAFDESVELFEIAERNAPSHADLIADHADTLIHSSRLEEALAKINLAFELNPLCPDYYWWVAAGANYSLRHYELAIDNLTHVADQNNVLRFNAACWAMLGDTRQARGYMRRTMENLPDFEIDKWLSMIPIRDPAHREHYREGLRRAGFK